jgi:adenosine kinase
MRTLVCGSLAFDTIMVFSDQFSRHILPEQAHVLSVSFMVEQMRREWGGCAGNIAYNLKHIGGEPVVMATVGDDGDDYRERLAAFGIGIEAVRQVPGTYTAQAFIITDLDDNQITAFHPGAMMFSHQNRVSDVHDIGLGIVSPDGKEGMSAHADQFASAGIPFVFDPGQGLPLFSGPELLAMIDKARYVAVNDYEGRLLAERTGLSLAAIAERVDALIVTLGGEGSYIYAGGKTLAIPAARPAAVLDPTGCGDAYRAGILHGLAHGWDWQRTGGLASVLGALKIASRGAQNHAVNREAVAALYHATFGAHLW